jgi:uncharacterized membrane protein YdjX (TVP38/TMEM64 family)
MKRAEAIRLSAGLLLAGALALAAANRDALDAGSLQRWIAEAGAWAPLAFIAGYAVATVLFLPGSLLTLAAGAAFGALPGAAYSLTGATLGASLAFLVARHVAGGWVERHVGGRLWQLVAGVEAEGWRFVAFVRLVPVFPFNLVNYALGLTRIGLRPYVLASAICMAPGALAYAWLGHAGREALAGADGAIRHGLLALALLAAVMFLPRLVRRLRATDSITPQSLRALLAEGGIRLVDVRRAEEFAGEAGSIRGAANIPLETLPARADELAPWKDGGLVLICRTQVRSGQAAQRLAGLGFRNLRVVHGGMKAWGDLGYPVDLATRAPVPFVRPEAPSRV